MSNSSYLTSKFSRQRVITRLLTWLYGEDALFRSETGLIYPVNVRSWVDAPKESREVLGDLRSETRQFPSSSWLLNEMQQKNKHLWNGKTYALDPKSNRETITGGEDRLHCILGSYFDTVNTCTILEVELERAMAQLGPDPSPEQCYEALPLRRQLHGDHRGQKALQDAWTGRNRSAAIAISCCFVVNVGSKPNPRDQYRYFLRRRSDQVADGAGQYHIVPSMVFQPTGTDPFDPDSYNLEKTILKEVGEELFNYEEGDFNPLSYPEIADLKTLLDQGGATLKITGIGMDLLCLRPEFLTLLYVQDSTWFEHHGRSLCFSEHEYDYDSSSRESWRSILDGEPFQSEGELAPHRCVATGAISALLARQYLLQHLVV
jgi:hypothetical protein